MKYDATQREEHSEYTLGFLGFPELFRGVLGRVIGGQGWIRTSVRKTGQIYSLLPLTTRPPVHIPRVDFIVLVRHIPSKEAAQWRNAACLSMLEVRKGACSSTFSLSSKDSPMPSHKSERRRGKANVSGNPNFGAVMRFWPRLKIPTG